MRRNLPWASAKDWAGMAEITTLADAVADLVDDGDPVALEGFTHLIPFAADHEIARRVAGVAG